MFISEGSIVPFDVRILGVDYGRKRIGLALSDASGTLARPWKTIAGSGDPVPVARAIAAVVSSLHEEDEAVAAVVLGAPKRLSGEPNAQTGTVAKIAELLRGLIALPVILQDERLSSYEADAVLARSEKDWRKRKGLLDAMAAAVILQDYLDSQDRLRIRTEDDLA
jgi:putative holliday junction resolvase